MGEENTEKRTINAIKAYAFPTLLSLVSLMVYNDMQEVKSDIKALLAQSSEDKVRIDYLEKELLELRRQKVMTLPSNDNDEPSKNQQVTLYAIVPSKDDAIYERRSSNTKL